MMRTMQVTRARSMVGVEVVRVVRVERSAMGRCWGNRKTMWMQMWMRRREEGSDGIILEMVTMAAAVKVEVTWYRLSGRKQTAAEIRRMTCVAGSWRKSLAAMVVVEGMIGLCRPLHSCSWLYY